MEWTCRDIAKMIDHSLLKPELTIDEIRKGCEVAKKYGVASVCCAASALPLVAMLLKGTDIKPTTVIGFPHGYNKTETKVFEAEQAMKDGHSNLIWFSTSANSKAGTSITFAVI